MPGARVTDADFDRLSWHDNAIHGFRFALPEPDLGDWRCDLILDIDHIVEWLCDDAKTFRFRVAPADLVFHDAGNFKIDLDFGPSMLSEISISEIHRERAAPRFKSAPPSYDWRIEVHTPVRGMIAFNASGFSQTLRGAPLLLEAQSLTRAERAGFPVPVYP